MPSKKKLLIVDVAALGWELARQQNKFTFEKAESVLPAVTCTIQASFRTATLPQEHGLVSNGLYFRDLNKVLFWEQSASLVSGARIWEAFRAAGGKVGMMFWQQSLGEQLDLVLSPAPIHKHSGGMIQDCYSQPAGLYDRLKAVVGRPFNLMNYWGPLASRKSSDWVVEATLAVLEMEGVAPDLLFTYIPHLDYDLQRHGPASKQSATALEVLLGYLDRLQLQAVRCGYEILCFGDYSIERVTTPAVFPNRCLREAGLLAVREIKEMNYIDYFASRAFAVVDHQVAHVFARDAEAATRAREALSAMPGLEAILDRDRQKERGFGHHNSGELVLIAEPGAWFAYPWWSEKKQAPDYATHVDIHNKPGYDPCELFFGWPPLTVSMDVTRIKGTHGRTTPQASVAWFSSLTFTPTPSTLLELAVATKRWLDAQT